MDTGEQGVNNAEANTAANSPEANQTVESTAATSGDTNQSTQAAENKNPETVPYERLSETTQKLRQTEETVAQMQREMQELKSSQTKAQANTANVDPEKTALKEKAKEALKPILEEMGYVSKDELRKREIDQQVETTVQALEKELDGSDGRPKFERKSVYDYALKRGIPDPRAAYELMNQKAIIDWNVQQAIKAGKGLQTEGSNGTGSQNVGTSDEELKSKIGSDAGARHLYLKRIASRMNSK